MTSEEPRPPMPSEPANPPADRTSPDPPTSAPPSAPATTRPVIPRQGTGPALIAAGPSAAGQEPSGTTTPPAPSHPSAQLPAKSAPPSSDDAPGSAPVGSPVPSEVERAAALDGALELEVSAKQGRRRFLFFGRRTPAAPSAASTAPPTASASSAPPSAGASATPSAASASASTASTSPSGATPSPAGATVLAAPAITSTQLAAGSAGSSDGPSGTAGPSRSGVGSASESATALADPPSTAGAAEQAGGAPGRALSRVAAPDPFPTERPPGAPVDPWTAFLITPERPPGLIRRVTGAFFRSLIHEYALAIYAGLLLAVGLTWPTLRYPLHTLPEDLGDPARQAWQISWIGHILLTHPQQLWQSNAFHPEPNSLAFGDSLLGYGPIGMLGDGPLAATLRYNILFVLAHALLAIGGYALVRQLGAGRTGAAFAAVAIAYAPWRLAQEGHLDIISAGGIPLALAMLARGHGWSLRRGLQPRERNAGWAAFGWLVAAWQVSLGFSLGLPFLGVLGLIVLALLFGTPIIWSRRRARRRAHLLNQATAQPDPAQPDPAQPRAAQADLAAPNVAAPNLTPPGLARPGNAQTTTAQPGAAQPDLAAPNLAQPGSARAATAQPGAARPDLAAPNLTSPDLAQSGSAKSGAAALSVTPPGMGRRDVALPGVDQSSAGEAGAGETGAGGSSTDPAKQGREPTGEKPARSDPTTDERGGNPTAGSRGTSDPVDVRPVSGESLVGRTVVDSPTAGSQPADGRPDAVRPESHNSAPAEASASEPGGDEPTGDRAGGDRGLKEHLPPDQAVDQAAEKPGDSNIRVVQGTPADEQAVDERSSDRKTTEEAVEVRQASDDDAAATGKAVADGNTAPDRGNIGQVAAGEEKAVGDKAASTSKAVGRHAKAKPGRRRAIKTPRPLRERDLHPVLGWRLLIIDSLGLLILAGIAALIALPYFHLADKTNRVAEIKFFSPPLWSLLIGPAESRIWGAPHEAARTALGWPPEMSLLPGFVLYALALAGLFFSVWSFSRRILLLIALAASVVLTLGTNFFGGRWSYLPLFGHLPASLGQRIPGRMILWVTLLLGILAAGAVGEFVRRAEHWSAQRMPPWPAWWLRLATLVPLMLVIAEGWNTTAHPVVPAQPASMRTITSPMLVLPTGAVTDGTAMLWSTTRYQKIANGLGGFAAARQAEMRNSVASFPDAASIQYLRSINVDTVVLIRSAVAGTPWERAGDTPVDALGIRREDADDAVIFHLS